MKATMVPLALVLAASTATVSAQPVRWTRYTISQTGTSVDHGRSRPTRRVRAAIPNRRRPRRPHDPGCAQPRERFTRRFSRQEAPTFPHPVQARDVALLRGFQVQGGQGFLRPLQLLRAAGPLRVDQLSRRGRACLGRRRHPHEPFPQRQVGDSTVSGGERVCVAATVLRKPSRDLLNSIVAQPLASVTPLIPAERSSEYKSSQRRGL
jgi:hypothetical protein